MFDERDQLSTSLSQQSFQPHGSFSIQSDVFGGIMKTQTQMWSGGRDRFGDHIIGTSVNIYNIAKFQSQNKVF